MRRAGAWLSMVLGLALWPTPARATWSIAAVDPHTREVGVAVASCVEAPYGSTILPYVAGLAPGHGALAAQALYDQALRDQALALLLRGATPQAVIDAVVAGDPQAATRQYGVVALDLPAAAFTGIDTQPWAGHQHGLGVSVQGNILQGPEVVAHALVAFEAEAPGCPWTLADRLMLALEAGAARGGDARCSPEQAALAAALRVAAPGDDPDAPGLDLRIPSQPAGGDAPVALLRAAYDQWRLEHPPDASRCPSGATADGTIGAASAETGVDDRATATHDPSGTAGSTPPGSHGCHCRSTPAPWAPLLVLLLALRRRGAPRARIRIPPRSQSISPDVRNEPLGR